MDDFTTYNHVYKETSPTSLNTLTVWIPKSQNPPPSTSTSTSSQPPSTPSLTPSSSTPALWLIYIKGGAWRDPKITATSFIPTLTTLSQSPSSQQIKSYASLNYRLSSHPTDPTSKNDPSRTAKHPDHINDISTAILYLETHYQISTPGYILLGHSCGACLSFQLPTSYLGTPIPPPLMIIGSEGIYDFDTLLRTHSSIPVYRDFITRAFGDDESEWREISPASATTREAAWQRAKVVVVSHSPDDELVDQVQADLMVEGVKRYLGEGEEGRGEPFCVEVPAKGRHDEVWEEGEELARVVGRSLEIFHARG